MEKINSDLTKIFEHGMGDQQGLFTASNKYFLNVQAPLNVTVSITFKYLSLEWCRTVSFHFPDLKGFTINILNHVCTQ